MQVFDLSIKLKCNRPSATRRLARCSTSFARGRRGFLFSLWGWGGRLACHRLGPPFVCQYVKDRGDMDSAGEADVCRGLSGGGPAQESCSCCKVRSFCQPSRAIRCDWMRLGEITWDNEWWGWNETQGDGNTLLSKLRANGWGQRGEGPSQKGPQRGEHPPGGPWRKRHHSIWEASEKEERSSCSSYSSIPIHFKTPPFFSYYL